MADEDHGFWVIAAGDIHQARFERPRNILNILPTATIFNLGFISIDDDPCDGMGPAFVCQHLGQGVARPHVLFPPFFFEGPKSMPTKSMDNDNAKNKSTLKSTYSVVLAYSILW
jgi:hypothetical protein